MTPSATPSAFASRTELKPLGFDPAKLNGLSERLIRSHWENNYRGSVKALAVVEKQLSDALANRGPPPYVYNDLKREHLMRTGCEVHRRVLPEHPLARLGEAKKLVGGQS